MLRFLDLFNDTIGVLLFAAYLYQFFYTLYALVMHRRSRQKKAPAVNTPLHRFAAIICARNEEHVIGELISSLRAQDYPSELLDVYVLADNCTDGTASAAREAGATVFERFNQERVGKGFALDYLFKRIKSSFPDKHYDAYLVFDADNLVDHGFVRAMNATFSQGYDVLTSYRNSKNFGSSWVSACYSIWFLRESRFLNYPRMLLRTNCAISGTGFLVSSRIIEENGGWPYFLLTEDIEFSVCCALRGWRIGYCDEAMVYDEQPVSMRQSWRQRMGSSQVSYQRPAPVALGLLGGSFTGKRRFSCYDMLMTIAPCMLLTLITVVVNLSIAASFLFQPQFLAMLMCAAALSYVLRALVYFYVMLFFYGLLTVMVEWRKIPAKALKKVLYLPLFPLFMFTYIPIGLAALFMRVQWKPIRHTSVENVKV